MISLLNPTVTPSTPSIKASSVLGDQDKVLVMADAADAPPLSMPNYMALSKFHQFILDDDSGANIVVLRERYRCAHFRVLVIGRANAGKTTILEKVCGVDKETEPIIYDKNGKTS